MRDCSDEYLYWDNAETAKVQLKSVFDIDIQSYVSKEFTEAVVRRTSDTTEFPNFNQLEIAGEAEVLCVAAATIGGGPLVDGDVITVGNDRLTVSGDVRVIRAGSSISHFKAICYGQRG